MIRALQIGYRHLDLAEAYGNLVIMNEALNTAFKHISERSLDQHHFLLQFLNEINGKNQIAL
jgi:diketogulonate reductase-like aldo/keto reductase